AQKLFKLENLIPKRGGLSDSFERLLTQLFELAVFFLEIILTALEAGFEFIQLCGQRFHFGLNLTEKRHTRLALRLQTFLPRSNAGLLAQRLFNAGFEITHLLALRGSLIARPFRRQPQRRTLLRSPSQRTFLFFIEAMRFSLLFFALLGQRGLLL